MNEPQSQQIDPSQIEQARRQINRLAEEIAQLSEAELSPPEYYGEFLQRLLAAIAAPAGAVWLKTPQGNLQLQYQINMRQVGLDRGENTRQEHDELLRQATAKGQPGLFPPHSSLGQAEGQAVAPGNPTDHYILMAPILYDKQVAGLVEVWQDANRPREAQQGFLQFMVKMAALAAGYTRNFQLRQMVGQQAVWQQLETFARQIHGTLNPTEVAYLVANEGRRLVEADRVSVAIRQGSKSQVTAISGADIVEKRSNLVQLMRALFDAVLNWGEKLVYTGVKDDTLPPAVNKALDAFLAESNSKLLVIMPLPDERDKDKKRPARSALMMESFESSENHEQAVARLEVVGRHATSALYNAAEYKRIPMRFIWLPLAKLQDGLGGKARAIGITICVGLGALIAALIFIPYPLKMDAHGQLLPIKRAWVYPPVEGLVREIKAGLTSGSVVNADEELMRMYDEGLAKRLRELDKDIKAAEGQLKLALTLPEGDKDKGIRSEEARITLAAKWSEREALIKRTHADSKNPGEFMIRAPLAGVVLSSDFREQLLNRPVKQSDPLLRIGFLNPDKKAREDWEIELKIPQKHIGQVLTAFRNLPEGSELDVDLLLTSAPTRTFKGKLKRDKVAAQANVDKDNNAEPDPIVLAWVRIEGKDIPPEYRIPTELLLTGTEVHARVRCGNRAMGYSLFYGVWEFIYEKIVFFF
ncbi:MAG: hypothetical protein U0793_09660 [Gemmataceae bacterium]